MPPAGVFGKGQDHGVGRVGFPYVDPWQAEAVMPAVHEIRHEGGLGLGGGGHVIGICGSKVAFQRGAGRR